jgi:hypothetical protein
MSETGIFTDFLANSTSIEEYKAKLDRFKRERMAR